MNKEKGKVQEDSGLRAALDQAFEESINRQEVDECEQAVAGEQERNFHNEILQLLEAKWGKSLVADRRTFMVEGKKYELSAAEVYIDLEGEDAFARRKQLFGLKNKKSTITLKESDDVVELNRKLESEFPKKTPRYREIAEKLDMKPERVRYIIKVALENK